MSFDRAGLAAAVAAHGRVARVVVAATAGSAPREPGAAMLVWGAGQGAAQDGRQDTAQDGGQSGAQSGTIGGGRLEYDAAARARAALAGGGDRLDRVPLGPAAGQCCGGAVTLLTEIWDAARLAALPADAGVVARPVPGAATGAGPDPSPPLAVARGLSAARSGRDLPRPGLADGWMIEPAAPPVRALWIYGAGHVGRALVAVMAPLPGFAITWVDTGPARFPDPLPAGVAPLVAAEPAAAVAHAPRDADHLIVTYSHKLDLDLCHALLGHGFATAGLIGSRSKWARFRSRLAALGHPPARISRIACPIGDPGLGKHPQAIAVGVAAALLKNEGMRADARDGDRRTASGH